MTIQRQNPRPVNHKSAALLQNALRRSIREGQVNGTYLAITSEAAARYPELQYSPFGCVPKAGVDPHVEAHVIHDMSFPGGGSINDRSEQAAIPPLSYEHVDAIANRIIMLRSRSPTSPIKIMKGDVKSAFRHIHVHETLCASFAGSLPVSGLTVIDLALPFGWTGLPAFYGVFGGAISFLVRRESPHSLNPVSADAEPFFCFNWVADHVLVEHEHGDRLDGAENALRLAIIAVLGPRAINEKKFSAWSTTLTALGLEWNTLKLTVSMPTTKIEKALGRVHALLTAATTARHQLCKLLGRLRQVCSCICSAKPFFQRIVVLLKQALRTAPVSISQDARMDLVWFDYILRFGQLRGVSLSMFSILPNPDIHFYMDASNAGFCVLHPARSEYIQLRFDADERTMVASGRFSINVRQQFSATLAILCWAPPNLSAHERAVTQVRFWIDNAAAVSWCNKLASPNPTSQELNRILCAAEAEWGHRVSAEHLPGCSNVLADIGSRAWSEPYQSKWRALTGFQTQVTIPQHLRKIYKTDSSPFSSAPWLPPLSGSTPIPGNSGSLSVNASVAPPGSAKTTPPCSLFNWFFSPFIGGHQLNVRRDPSPLTPFAPSLAMSSGIIESMPDSSQPSPAAMPRRSLVCVESAR